MTDAPWNGDERNLHRREASEHARKTADYLIGGLRDFSDVETTDQTVTALRNIRRLIVAAFDNLAGNTKALFFLPAIFMARARRSASRLISATELTSGAFVGHVAAAAPIMVAIAFTGSVFGSGTQFASAHPLTGAHPIAHAVASQHSSDIEPSAVSARPTETIREFSTRLESPSKQLPTKADGRIRRDPRQIEIGHEIEFDANGEKYQTSKFTVGCDESSLVTSTACDAYDKVFLGNQ